MQSSSNNYNLKSTGDFWLLGIGLVLLMYKSNRILFVRPIPESLVYFFALILFIFYIRLNIKRFRKTSLFKITSIFWITVILWYDKFIVGTFDILGYICLCITILGATVLILTTDKVKLWILAFFTSCTQFIVAIGLFGWILYLLKVPMPHYTDFSDAYYIHTIYYLFNMNGLPDLQLVPRFAGPFLEPGHLGTMCVFLLYLNRFALKKMGNIVLLVGVLFSLSLAAYGLLLGSIVIYLYQQRKFLWISLILGIFLSFGLGAMIYNGGDNALNTAIVMRLEVNDDGEIAGNNRTSMAFDSAYARFLKSNQIWTGVGSAAFGTHENGTDNITLGCASYKRYFFLRGIIGSMLIVIFLLFYCLYYRSSWSFGFFIVYLVANLIRDYPTMEMWMYLYLMAIPCLSLMQKQQIKKIE